MTKFIDVGVMLKDSSMVMPEGKPKKKHYPSYTIDKELDVKMGQVVIAEGVVTGLRKDKWGNSVTVEVRQVGIKNKMSEDEFANLSDKEQRAELEKGR